MSRRVFSAVVCLTVAVCGLSSPLAADRSVSIRLPGDVPPVILAWFWRESEFEPGGYRYGIDLFAEHAACNLLATSLRVPEKEVTDDDVHAQVKAAAAYARKRGMGILMDLDVRLARRAFQKKHPDELQEMLRLREVALNDKGEVTGRITSQDLNDHYTHCTTHYIPLAGRLVRVYAYVRGPNGIEPNTVRDITKARCKITTASSKEVGVTIACDEKTKGCTACVMVGFTHLTPAVFGPHLIEFQREIIQRYADADLAGVCKDEWGFPPCYDGCPAKNDFWYSRFRADAYARRTGGRDLLRDALLMTFPHRSLERRRQAVINHFMRMSTLRNGAIEDDFHRTTKATFGPAAVAATHPTWYPYPGTREFKKNGLDWWIATRDLAQTDEVTPYCVRTSLAKKWTSGLWWNMYYSRDVADYRREIWSHALGGGRIDVHPVYPRKPDLSFYDSYKMLLGGPIMRGRCRIRLLNFISRSALDCPVAVVFGHACAMNWAGPAYDDVGIALTDALWRAGYPADLIPTTEIPGKTLQIGNDGHIRYGPQSYSAVVLYHPEFENPQTADFFNKAARGKTALYRVGDWTANFDGKPFDGNAALPKEMVALPDAKTCAARVLALLRERRLAPQTPASETMTRFGRRSCAPPAEGHCRLIDGTHIFLAGAEHAAGDPIRTTFDLNGRQVTVDAVGVVGVRLDKHGQLEALAAGGLKRLRVGSVDIELPDRIDLAFWTDDAGHPRGVLQGYTGPVPEPLAAITKHWLRLVLPVPLPE